jgi:uncharacterized protein HemX
MKKLINWVKKYFDDRKRKKRFKKKLEELRKRDPFIYNH